MVHDEIDSLSNGRGDDVQLRQWRDQRQSGWGQVDWITDYTFDVHAYPNERARRLWRRSITFTALIYAELREADGGVRHAGVGGVRGGGLAGAAGAQREAGGAV